MSIPEAAGAGRVTGSFRDPSGFLFWKDGTLYRQVNSVYRPHYDRLMASGLYDKLIAARLLVPHSEVSLQLAASADAYRVIQPEMVPFVSYPYEWCFGQLKDAALTTLAVQKLALRFDMTLKDASAYNVQFVGSRPLLVDTLSFEEYHAGGIWLAYRQFCQHFLAPLALMSARDVRLGELLRVHVDGVPLDLAALLLPQRTRLRPGLLAHIHLHARAQQAYASRRVDFERTRRAMTRQQLLGLIESLEAAVRRLVWQPKRAGWAGYYEGDSYEAAGLGHKRELVAEFIRLAGPRSLWDLGANTGLFTRIACAAGVRCVAWDADHAAVEINYRQARAEADENILPLVQDLTNPSPAQGWAHEERASLMQRGPVDAVLALALVHHLAIGNNVPLDQLAAFLAGLCSWLVVEFVPKTDPKVQLLLSSRQDIFPDYTQAGFEAAFARAFSIQHSEKIRDSARVLYLMRKR